MSAVSRGVRIRSRVLVAGVLAALLVACDGTGPASPDREGDRASIALSVLMQQVANDGGEAQAYDAVDGVRIVIRTSGGSTLYDVLSRFDPQGAETRVPLTVPIDEATQVTLEVTLFRGADPLFTGTGSLNLVPNDVTQANLELVPVAASIEVPSSLTPPLKSIGETRELSGNVLFATGDVAGSLRLTWTSLTPQVVSVRTQGTSSSAVAVGPGQGRLQASYGALKEVVGVDVDPVTDRVVVQPSSPTVSAGGTVQLVASALDAGGTAVAGRPATWKTSDASVATVGGSGLVAGVKGGTATISATIDGVIGQTVVTVIAKPPVVETRPADQIGVYDAQLHGMVRPLGSSTSAWFQWGTDPTLTQHSSTGHVDAGSGTESVAVSGSLGGAAQPGTTYYFRVFAQNAGGTRGGAIRTFKTLPVRPPAVSAQTPSPVGLTSATLLGLVNPRGTSTTAWFEWGSDQNLSGFSETTHQDVGPGTSDVGIASPISGLADEGVYYLRVAATNEGGVSRSSILRFQTRPPAPTGFSASFDGDLYMGWTDNSSSETSFVIQRSTTSATAGFTSSSSVGANQMYSSEKGPFPTRVMWYRVVACNATSCSAPSNVVQVTAPTPDITGTLYLCSSSDIGSCKYYGSQTVTLSGAFSDTTTSDGNFGYYYFYSGLVGGSTYTVSVNDVSCEGDFRTNQVTVTPGWGETVVVDFYADRIPCEVPDL